METSTTLGGYFFDHPRQLFFAIAVALVLIIVLFVWNIVLTVLVANSLKKKSGVKCPKCQGDDISILKTSANEGNKLYNVCQRCGETWEISKN